MARGLEAWNGRSVEADSRQVPLLLEEMAPPSGCTYIRSTAPYTRWPFNTASAPAQLQMFAEATGDQSLSGGAFAQVHSAIADWMSVSNTSLSLAYGGPMSYSRTCSSGQDTPAYGVNIVLFNDQCSDIADLSGCSGTLAFGGPWYGGSHTFDGATWYSIGSWFVVINNGVGCLGATNYQRMVAHEMGHGLGFGHFSDNRSLMYAYCCNTINATDTLCAQSTYPGSGSTPTPTPVPPTATPSATHAHTGATDRNASAADCDAGAAYRDTGASDCDASAADKRVLAEMNYNFHPAWMKGIFRISFTILTIRTYAAR